MIKRILMAIIMFASISHAMASTSSDSIPKKEELADIKYEISIQTTEKAKFNIIATKAFHPNIYRDGKIVSQGDYESENIKGTSLNTTLTHKGLVFILGIMIYPISDITSDDATAKIHVKLYQNEKLIQEFSKEREIQDGFSESFEHWVNPPQ